MEAPGGGTEWTAPLALPRGSHFAWVPLSFSGLSLKESQASSPPLTGKQNRCVGKPQQASLKMGPEASLEGRKCQLARGCRLGGPREGLSGAGRSPEFGSFSNPHRECEMMVVHMPHTSLYICFITSLISAVWTELATEDPLS